MHAEFPELYSSEFESSGLFGGVSTVDVHGKKFLSTVVDFEEGRSFVLWSVGEDGLEGLSKVLPEAEAITSIPLICEGKSCDDVFASYTPKYYELFISNETDNSLNVIEVKFDGRDYSSGSYETDEYKIVDTLVPMSFAGVMTVNVYEISKSSPPVTIKIELPPKGGSFETDNFEKAIMMSSSVTKMTEISIIFDGEGVIISVYE